MKVVATAVLAAALFVMPTASFAGGKRVYAPAPAPCAQVCPPAPCAPACPTPCFNPLSIVGGVVSGVGSAISAVGCGISGLFGTCN